MESRNNQIPAIWNSAAFTISFLYQFLARKYAVNEVSKNEVKK